MAEKKVKKGGLGKGLDAIFAENTSETEGTVEIKINDIAKLYQFIKGKIKTLD